MTVFGSAPVEYAKLTLREAHAGWGVQMNTLNSSVNTVHVQFSSRSVHLFSDDHPVFTLCSRSVHVQFTSPEDPRGNASHVRTITHRKPKQRTGVPHKRISTVTKPYLYHCKCIATQVTATHPFALHSWIDCEGTKLSPAPRALRLFPRSSPGSSPGSSSTSVMRKC